MGHYLISARPPSYLVFSHQMSFWTISRIVLQGIRSIFDAIRNSALPSVQASITYYTKAMAAPISSGSILHRPGLLATVLIGELR